DGGQPRGLGLEALADAELLVEYLKTSVTVWQKYPSNNFGLEQILYYGPRELQEWYGARLKDILARAGDFPLDLPKLGELRGLMAGKPRWAHDPALRRMPTGEFQDTQFAPRVALASLVEWDGTFLEEDERLVEMESRLRDV